MRCIIIFLPLILSSCDRGQPSGNASSSELVGMKTDAPAISSNVQAVQRLMLAIPEFRARPTIFPRDESPQWHGIQNFTKGSIFGVMDVVGCGNGHDRIEPVETDVANFNGRLLSETPNATSRESAFSVLDGMGFFETRTRTITSRFAPQIYHCHVFSDRMKEWTDHHPELLDPSKDPPGLAFAERSEPVFEFQNEYRTELPLKGQVPVVSLRFNYALHPLMRGLAASGRGAGAAKAFLDSDSGLWSFLEFQLHDPDIVYTRPQ